MKILDQNFYYAAKIGFEFEFMSSFSRDEIAEKIGEDLGKQVKVFRRYHSKFSPTRDIFKLEPDFSGGLKMVELITGPMDYFEAIPVLIRILKWIDENGYTNERCALQFGLSFDRNKYPALIEFGNLNPLKFVLGFDEEYVWKRFPERRGSLYAKSIKRITPANKFIRRNNNILGDRNAYTVYTEKNMGINLTKLEDGYMEVRYMGGTDYQKKYKEIKEVIDYVITHTFSSILDNDTLNQKETEILSELISKIYKETETFIDAESFMMNYRDLHVTVDLREDLQIIKTYFNEMRHLLYSLIVENGITEGFLNYDTQISRYQLKDGKTQVASMLKDLDLIECDIEGNIANCRLFGSQFKNCQFEDCEAVMHNDIKDSKIIDCTLGPSNTVIDSYIDSREKEISCEVTGGVIRSGYITSLAYISETTEVITNAADGKSKGKGKGEKMLRGNIFADRNYSDSKGPLTGFDDLNNTKPSFSVNKLFKNNN